MCVREYFFFWCWCYTKDWTSNESFWHAINNTKRRDHVRYSWLLVIALIHNDCCCLVFFLLYYTARHLFQSHFYFTWFTFFYSSVSKYGMCGFYLNTNPKSWILCNLSFDMCQLRWSLIIWKWEGKNYWTFYKKSIRTLSNGLKWWILIEIMRWD